MEVLAISPRLLLFVIFFSSFILCLILRNFEKEFSEKYHSIDAIVPAYNEEVTISRTVCDLINNKYISRVIVVDDGSKDNTLRVLKDIKRKYEDKLIIISQKNTGKAGAINNAIECVESDYVFLTDADIRIPNNDGLGYMIRLMENGGDAVAGIPGSDLNNINFLGKIRASIKIFFATYRKCGMEFLGGHPFCIPGSAGMYRTIVLKKVKFPERTCVEDLDLTWELISRGYNVLQSTKAIVYSQEASSFVDDIKRWRRWISGYAVCMRIHRKLLFTRFGLVVIVPNFILGMFSILLLMIPFFVNFQGALIGFIIWSSILSIASWYSASKQGRKWWLLLYAPLSIIFLVVIFFCWIMWGIPALITGKEKGWSKVTRY